MNFSLQALQRLYNIIEETLPPVAEWQLNNNPTTFILLRIFLCHLFLMPAWGLGDMYTSYDRSMMTRSLELWLWMGWQQEEVGTEKHCSSAKVRRGHVKKHKSMSSNLRQRYFKTHAIPSHSETYKQCVKLISRVSGVLGDSMPSMAIKSWW